MVNAINNVNFKGVYTPKFTKFSDSQQRVFEDIKNKLKDKKTKKLLLIATGALTNSTSTQQGESIPGIAHAVSIEI